MLGPVAVSACTLGSTSCTLGGYESRVRLESSDSIQITQFCVEDVCLPGPGDLVGIAVPVGEEPAEYEYRLAFTDDMGQARMVEGTVSTKEYRVNGPSCDPVTANATLTVRDGGEIEVSHP